MRHSNRMIYIFGLSPFDITFILLVSTLIVEAVLATLIEGDFLYFEELAYNLEYVSNILKTYILPSLYTLHVISTINFLITPEKYKKYSRETEEVLDGVYEFRIADREYDVGRFKYPLIYIIYITYLYDITDIHGLDDVLIKLLDNKCIVLKELDIGNSTNIVKRGYALPVTDELSVQIYLYPDEILYRINELENIFDDVKLELMYIDDI